MKIVFEDRDLEELITTGRNSKYKKYTRNAKFMKALATAYNYMRLVDAASDLPIRVVNGMVERILFREFDGGISITVLSLDDTHYGNKK